MRPKTAAMFHEAIERFKKWLAANGYSTIKTGQLSKGILETCFLEFAATPGRLGKTKRVRSPATVSLYKRNIRACLRWIDEFQPPVFQNFKPLAAALKPGATGGGDPKAFEPKELVKFLETALEREEPGRVAKVFNSKPGQREREGYLQPLTERANTPVSRLFLLLALGGMRLGEALALKWSDVDLERGRMRIYAMKTNRKRTLPLIDRTGDDRHIAPRFLELLRRWKIEAGEREYLLPHIELDHPTYPQSAWQGANKAAKLQRIGPQHLRQNFCSYACSLGVEAGVAALWQGHSPAIANAYYKAEVLDRQAGKSFEEAMGLLPVIERLLKTKGRANIHELAKAPEVA
jgi:integrase